MACMCFELGICGCLCVRFLLMSLCFVFAIHCVMLYEMVFVSLFVCLCLLACVLCVCFVCELL